MKIPTEAQECIVPFCSWQKKFSKQFTKLCAPPLGSSVLGISGGSSLGNYDFSVFEGQSSIVRFFSVFQLEELHIERERELPPGGSKHQNESLLRIYVP